MRSQFHITKKFIGFILLTSILPLLAVGISSYRVSSKTVQKEAIKYTAELVDQQQEYLELQLRQIESLITNISGVDTILDTLADTSAQANTYSSLATQARIGYILNGYTSLEGLVSIDIFTLKGNHYHVGDTLNVSQVRDELKHRIFLQALDQDRHVAWVGIEDNVNVNSSSSKVITAAKVLYTVDPRALKSEPMAMVLVNYSVDYLYEHFSQVHVGEGAYLVVIDAQNRIIYHPDKALIGKTLYPALAQMVRQGQGTLVQTIDGQPMLVSYARSAMSDWVVVNLVPMKTLMAPAAAIRQTTLLVLGLSFGVLFLAAGLVTAQVVVPIRQITGRFKLFQEGAAGWDQPLPVHGTDEIAELSTWFNAFLDSLAARQRAEKELAQAKEAAEAASLAKSRFLANISHELRTPLNAILGFTHLLATDPQTAASQRESLAIINQSGEHLVNLINDVLDISKIEAGKVTLEEQPVDFYALLTTLSDLFQLAARSKNLDLVCNRISPLPRYIQVDEGKLRQILTNLLSNAVKFTATGRVTFSVSAEPIAADLAALPAPLAHPEQVLPRWRLAFAVQDTGPTLTRGQAAGSGQSAAGTDRGRCQTKPPDFGENSRGSWL